jgi:hypothetical protein
MSNLSSRSGKHLKQVTSKGGFQSSGQRVNRGLKRYLGLDLAGAKNVKTTLASLQYYAHEEKLFLLDIYEGIGPVENISGDESLIETVAEYSENRAHLGVNVALNYPPCVTCTRKSCPLPLKCTVPTVKWMKDTLSKYQIKKKKNFKAGFLTPYTQNPSEIWIKHNVLKTLPQTSHFDIDEALGGNRAPLTSRMHFIKRHLKKTTIIETSPKLSVALLGKQFGIPTRTLRTYRQIEDGAFARNKIIEVLTEECGIFIYDRDQKKLSQSLGAFDSFICAYTAYLDDNGFCEPMPKGFPSEEGWIRYPICRK